MSKFQLARILLSRVVTVAGVLTVLGALAKGYEELQSLRKSPKPDGDGDDTLGLTPGAAAAESDDVDEVEAGRVAKAIELLFEQVEDADRQARDRMVTVVAEGLAKCKVPFANRVTGILVMTVGQTPHGALMIGMLIAKMATCDASRMFLEAMKDRLMPLLEVLPTSEELIELRAELSSRVSHVATSVGDAFGSVVGGVYDFGSSIIEGFRPKREVDENAEAEEKERVDV